MKFLRLFNDLHVNIANIVSIENTCYLVTVKMVNGDIHKLEVPTGKARDTAESLIRRIEGVGLSSEG